MADVPFGASVFSRQHKRAVHGCAARIFFADPRKGTIAVQGISQRILAAEAAAFRQKWRQILYFLYHLVVYYIVK